eukprot:4059946-Pleurochrysis_carterae.AAC.1
MLHIVSASYELSVIEMCKARRLRSENPCVSHALHARLAARRRLAKARLRYLSVLNATRGGVSSAFGGIGRPYSTTCLPEDQSKPTARERTQIT